MKYIVKAKQLNFSSSCDRFCVVKCDRVGKCQSKQR